MLHRVAAPTIMKYICFKETKTISNLTEHSQRTRMIETSLVVITQNINALRDVSARTVVNIITVIERMRVWRIGVP